MIKKFWKKLKYWQKGGIIGAIVYGSYGALYHVIAPQCGWDCYNLWVFTLLIPELLTMKIHEPWLYIWSISTMNRFDFIVFTLISVLLGLVLGAIIGLIVERIKKQQKVARVN